MSATRYLFFNLHDVPIWIKEPKDALAQKLDAEVEIQRLWTKAFAKRNLQTYVFGSGGVKALGFFVG